MSIATHVFLLPCTAQRCPQVPHRGLTAVFVGSTLISRLSDLGGLGRIGVTVPAGCPKATAEVAVDHSFGRRVSAGILAAAMPMGLGACTGSPDAPPSPASTTPGVSDSAVSAGSASVSPTDGPAEVLSHYSRFFSALPDVSRMDEPERNDHLRRYLTGPAYVTVVKSMSAQAEFGKALYGQAVLQPRVTSIHSDSAVVRDCQDTSKSGVEDVDTGEKETRGVPRTLVITNLKRTGDSWRISKIDYRGPKC
jgi:hypothetical protein